MFQFEREYADMEQAEFELVDVTCRNSTFSVTTGSVDRQRWRGRGVSANVLNRVFGWLKIQRVARTKKLQDATRLVGNLPVAPVDHNRP